MRETVTKQPNRATFESCRPAQVQCEKDLLTHCGVVYPAQCDHNGHMNVMWYVGKFDEATWRLFTAVGITPAYLRDTCRGMVAVEQHLAYKRELFAGDTLAVNSAILGVTDKTLRFEHVMRRNGEAAVAATSTITGVHIDALERKAVPFSPELRQALSRFAQGFAG